VWVRSSRKSLCPISFRTSRRQRIA
jgi:hypothetical protein